MKRFLIVAAAVVPFLAGVPGDKVARAAGTAHAFSVSLAAGRIQGADTLKVRQGEQVDVRITSDRPIVLHLHGYEIETKVAPPQPALMSFKADVPGRFPVHEHREGAGNHRAILFVEVHP
jgi:hypothetical protein